MFIRLFKKIRQNNLCIEWMIAFCTVRQAFNFQLTLDQNLGGRVGESRAMTESCYYINIIILDSVIAVFQCAWLYQDVVFIQELLYIVDIFFQTIHFLHVVEIVSYPCW